MYLVHQKKHKEGRWEVAWMWLPHFLAADLELHKHVDRKMTEAFRGETTEDLSLLLAKMSEKAVNLILEKYPIPGLLQLLESYSNLNPEESL
jgi:hypothetical protein